MTAQPWSDHDHQFEQRMLGYLLLGDFDGEQRNAAFVRASSTIETGDLHAEASRLVWGAMEAIHTAGKEIDPYQVVAELMMDGTLKQAGGADGVVGLCEGLISSVYLPQLTRNVLELSHRRQIVSVGSDVMHSAPRGDLNETLAEGAAQLKSLEVFGGRSIATATGKGACNYADEVARTIKSGGRKRGVTTGLASLDAITLGWHPGDLVVVAGRTAMGKTALALNSAVAGARQGKIPLICNLEMSKEQMNQRLLSAIGRIPLTGIRECVLDERDQAAMASAGVELARLRMYDIDHSPGYMLHALVEEVRAIHAQTPLSTLWVDYLQYLSALTPRGWSREQVVSMVSAGLKALAKDLQITVIALAQLNRGVESRDDKRPRLSDLRESGAIEQDADLILFLYRDCVYHGDDDSPVSYLREAEIIIAKHRQGALGRLDMTFRGEIVTWSDGRE